MFETEININLDKDIFLSKNRKSKLETEISHTDVIACSIISIKLRSLN